MPNPEGIGGFRAGQSGNPAGSRRVRLWKAAIERVVTKPIEGKLDLSRIDTLAEALIMAGEAGDTAALKEIGDRLDGKVPQGLIGGDDGDKPLIPSTIEIVLKSAPNADRDT